MKYTASENVFFDDRATCAMGAAYDEACRSITRLASSDEVRELLARRIIEAAKTGPCNRPRLLSRALVGFFNDDISMAPVGIVPQVPAPAYALVTRTA